MNNDGSDGDAAHVEAMMRRIWSANPNIRLIAMNFFGVSDKDVDANVNTPTTQTAQDKYTTILTAYGVRIVDYYAAVKDLVNNQGHHLNEYFQDTIHPSTAGYILAESLLQPYLPLGGVAKPGTYPAYVQAASSDFENTPVVKNGTAYDSRTGVWTDSGSSTSSSSAGATITYSGTFRSFGCYQMINPVYPEVSVSIDGGAYIDNFAFYNNGYDIGARAAHTVIIKVATTCKIDEFWAI